VPEIQGWTATIAFDNSKVEYTNGSFAWTEFVPGLTGLEIRTTDYVEVGGVVLGDGFGSGEGKMATVSFELTEGFTGQTELELTNIVLRLVDGTEVAFTVSFVVTITDEADLPGDFDGDGTVGFKDFFIFADVFGTTSDVGDLDGDGIVGFSDFFLFADNFGASAAKLFALAREHIGLPEGTTLSQNYPNPFNAETTIPYMVGMSGSVRLDLFDMTGQLVRQLVSRTHSVGLYKANWDARNSEGLPVSSGLYIVRLIAVDRIETRKVLFLK
jgi:hypothetical protein